MARRNDVHSFFPAINKRSRLRDSKTIQIDSDSSSDSVICMSINETRLADNDKIKSSSRIIRKRKLFKAHQSSKKKCTELYVQSESAGQAKNSILHDYGTSSKENSIILNEDEVCIISENDRNIQIENFVNKNTDVAKIETKKLSKCSVNLQKIKSTVLEDLSNTQSDNLSAIKLKFEKINDKLGKILDVDEQKIIKKVERHFQKSLKYFGMTQNFDMQLQQIIDNCYIDLGQYQTKSCEIYTLLRTFIENIDQLTLSGKHVNNSVLKDNPNAYFDSINISSTPIIKVLRQIERAIEYYDSAEVVWNELEISPYIISSRLKKRYVHLYIHYCRSIGANVEIKRVLQHKKCHLKFDDILTLDNENNALSERNYAMNVAKNIENLVNKTGNFPDYHDVFNFTREILSKQCGDVLDSFNSSDGLESNKDTEMVKNKAQQLFVNFGRQLQNSRRNQLAESIDSLVKRFCNGSSASDVFARDPADFDLELQKKLETNRKLAENRLDETFESFSRRQVEESHSHSANSESHTHSANSESQIESDDESFKSDDTDTFVEVLDEYNSRQETCITESNISNINKNDLSLSLINDVDFNNSNECELNDVKCLATVVRDDDSTHDAALINANEPSQNSIIVHINTDAVKDSVQDSSIPDDVTKFDESKISFNNSIKSDACSKSETYIEKSEMNSYNSLEIIDSIEMTSQPLDCVEDSINTTIDKCDIDSLQRVVDIDFDVSNDVSKQSDKFFSHDVSGTCDNINSKVPHSHLRSDATYNSRHIVCDTEIDENHSLGKAIDSDSDTTFDGFFPITS